MLGQAVSGHCTGQHHESPTKSRRCESHGTTWAHRLRSTGRTRVSSCTLRREPVCRGHIFQMSTTNHKSVPSTDLGLEIISAKGRIHKHRVHEQQVLAASGLTLPAPAGNTSPAAPPTPARGLPESLAGSQTCRPPTDQQLREEWVRLIAGHAARPPSSGVLSAGAVSSCRTLSGGQGAQLLSRTGVRKAEQ